MLQMLVYDSCHILSKTSLALTCTSAKIQLPRVSGHTQRERERGRNTKREKAYANVQREIWIHIIKRSPLWIHTITISLTCGST
jgi:hypothetical protein